MTERRGSMEENRSWIIAIIGTVVVMLALGLYYVTQGPTVEKCMNKGYSWEECSR
jgi:hypothetical protein